MERLIKKYFIYRSRWWRFNRMLFPSPAEIRLIEILGGRVIRINWLKHRRTKFPFVFIISMGKVLNEEKFKREVRVGKYYLDFGNDIKWAIEVDGKNFHRDVVREFDRDSFLYTNGWRVMHIEAVRLWNNPSKVQRDVLHFLYAK